MIFGKWKISCNIPNKRTQIVWRKGSRKEKTWRKIRSWKTSKIRKTRNWTKITSWKIRVRKKGETRTWRKKRTRKAKSAKGIRTYQTRKRIRKITKRDRTKRSSWEAKDWADKCSAKLIIFEIRWYHRFVNNAFF